MIKNLFAKAIKKIHKDDYMKRIPSSIIGEGMMHPGNLYLFDYALKHMPKDGIVFEIGVYGGLSTNYLLHLMKINKIDSDLFACDAWIYEGYKDHKGIIETHMDGNENVSRIEYMSYIKNAFINSVQLLSKEKLPYTCHCTSDAFFQNFNTTNQFIDVFGRKYSINKKISFAYIDGNHSFEQTKKDFENTLNHLMINGFILIDDTYKGVGLESEVFGKQLKNLYQNIRIVDKNPNILIQKLSD